MENTRPYWKVIVSLTFSILATVLFVVLGVKLLRLFIPFVIGWIIACIANPLVCWLEKHLKIVKKLGSAITIIAVLAAIIGFIYWGGSKIINEVIDFISYLPEMYHDIDSTLKQIGESMQGLLSLLPQSVRANWNAVADNFGSFIGEWISNLSVPTVEVAGNVAKSIPSILISTIVSIMSAYFFISDREEVIVWMKKFTPKPIENRMSMLVSSLKCAVGGYFKAQFQIMIVLMIIMFVGFLILDVNYAIVFALLFAFLDFLPFLGTAITLIPWAIYKFLGGDYKMAIGLLILYGLTQLVRQIIQPKLVGNEVGLKPLTTLALLYLGYKIGGVLAMIFSVPIGMILINMYEAGAFDYILDDVKILIHGIMKLRE